MRGHTASVKLGFSFVIVVYFPIQRRRLECKWGLFLAHTTTTSIYTLSLHDALPILGHVVRHLRDEPADVRAGRVGDVRSEEHTSELQSHSDLVCRLLLEKKKSGDQEKA